jgi:hypothetical protein
MTALLLAATNMIGAELVSLKRPLVLARSNAQ